MPRLSTYSPDNEFSRWFWKHYTPATMDPARYIHDRISAIDLAHPLLPTYVLEALRGSSPRPYVLYYNLLENAHSPINFAQYFWHEWPVWRHGLSGGSGGGDPSPSAYVQYMIDKLRLTMTETGSGEERGSRCPGGGSGGGAPPAVIQLYPYQIVHQVVCAPDSPLQRGLIVASTGAGKTCILAGLVGWWLQDLPDRQVFFVSTNAGLFMNFVKDSMRCPGYIQRVAQKKGYRATSPDDIAAFAKVLGRSIRSLKYTEFANMLSGKYAKYPSDLTRSLIVFDEVHYLVDSPSAVAGGGGAYQPTYERAPTAWRQNLFDVYSVLAARRDPRLKGCTLVGATATPMTDTPAQFLMLAQLFTNVHVPDLQRCIEMARNAQTPAEIQRAFYLAGDMFKLSVGMYLNKTSDKVLDRSILPDMIFKDAYVPCTASQRVAIKRTYKRLKAAAAGAGAPGAAAAGGGGLDPAARRRQQLQRVAMMDPVKVRGQGIHTALADRVSARAVTEKFAAVEHILNATQGKVVVYVRNKKDGVDALSYYLHRVMGMQPGKDFLLLAELGETSVYYPYSIRNEKDVPRVLAAFNAPGNRHGKGARVLVYSDAFVEGIDLKEVRYILLLQDPGTQGTYEQMIGRGVRACSHASLEARQWTVTIVHVYTQEEWSPDQILLAERKKSKTLFDAAMAVAKQLSMDCSVTASTNQYACIR
jgi:hypothetical protein